MQDGIYYCLLATPAEHIRSLVSVIFVSGQARIHLTTVTLLQTPLLSFPLLFL